MGHTHPAHSPGSDGRHTKVGGRHLSLGAARLWVSRPVAGYLAHRRDPGQLDGGRKALYEHPAHLCPRVRPRARGCARVHGPDAERKGCAVGRHGRPDPQPHSRHHRGHDARRAVKHHCRAGRQRARSARSQFRHRCRVRFIPGCTAGSGRGADRRPFRCGDLGRYRSQHGGVQLCQVLQDRRAQPRWVPSLRRGRQRICDG